MLPRRAIGPSTQASASFLDIAFMSFSTRYTRRMDLKTLPLRANGWRTPACRSEGAEIDSRDGDARKSADSAGDVSGCGSTQYRLQSYVARRARSSAAMRR